MQQIAHKNNIIVIVQGRGRHLLIINLSSYISITLYIISHTGFEWGGGSEGVLHFWFWGGVGWEGALHFWF